MSGVNVVSGTWPAEIEDVAINGRIVVTADGTTTYQKVGDFNPKLEKNGHDTGYVFAGWYLDTECTQEFSFDNAQDTLEKFKAAGKFSITLYARWVDSNSLPKYKVTFVANEPASAIAKAKGLDSC